VLGRELLPQRRQVGFAARGAVEGGAVVHAVAEEEYAVKRVTAREELAREAVRGVAGLPADRGFLHQQRKDHWH
jgi:hypothetical protein